MNVAGDADMANYGMDHEIAIRKRLLARISHHMTEGVIRITADAVSDLLFDADEEMAKDPASWQGQNFAWVCVDWCSHRASA